MYVYIFCENSQRPYHVDYFYKKAPPQIFDWISNAPTTGGAVNEFVVAGWCRWRYLRLDQTTRNLTCSDLEIPLVVTGFKKIGCIPQGLVGWKGVKGQYDLVCVAPRFTVIIS